MIDWEFFPKNLRAPDSLKDVINSFNEVYSWISSKDNNLKSNQVLRIIRPSLEKHGFRVEKGKKKVDKIPVPVLFGRNGKPVKTFDVDAYNEEQQIVVEVEAGRGVMNNQFLKDLFQACMMYNVLYLAIAVRKEYKGRNDFEEVIKFMDTLYSSNRLKLPLHGVMIIGY